jgi:hypothetical protein
LLFCCGRRCCCSPWSWTRVHVDDPSPRIVEGGPGRRGRVGLAALALVALTLVALVWSVVVATATVASAALAAIAVTIMTLSAIAKGTRWSRGGRSKVVVGVERMQGRRRRVGAERGFL